jgi:hypothetical protein
MYPRSPLVEKRLGIRDVHLGDDVSQTGLQSNIVSTARTRFCGDLLRLTRTRARMSGPDWGEFTPILQRTFKRCVVHENTN